MEGCDWMLWSVLLRSRLLGQPPVEKRELPKAVEEGDMKPGRWGMEPERRRDCGEALAAGLETPVERPPGAGLKGLVEGVERAVAVFGMREDEGMGSGPPDELEKREGSVPARARLVDPSDAEVASALTKSGKLSPLGDSGMVSRKGVELPLVGGPHPW